MNVQKDTDAVAPVIQSRLPDTKLHRTIGEFARVLRSYRQRFLSSLTRRWKQTRAVTISASDKTE